MGAEQSTLASRPISGYVANHTPAADGNSSSGGSSTTVQRPRLQQSMSLDLTKARALHGSGSQFLQVPGAATSPDVIPEEENLDCGASDVSSSAGSSKENSPPLRAGSVSPRPVHPRPRRASISHFSDFSLFPDRYDNKGRPTSLGIARSVHEGGFVAAGTSPGGGPSGQQQFHGNSGVISRYNFHLR